MQDLLLLELLERLSKVELRPKRTNRSTSDEFTWRMKPVSISNYNTRYHSRLEFRSALLMSFSGHGQLGPNSKTRGSSINRRHGTRSEEVFTPWKRGCLHPHDSTCLWHPSKKTTLRENSFYHSGSQLWQKYFFIERSIYQTKINFYLYYVWIL